MTAGRAPKGERGRPLSGAAFLYCVSSRAFDELDKKIKEFEASEGM